ncbi:tetratricopeptide repeat protein [Streptomyces sp. NBC_01460]|uniref:tetratricopeptide repeat protein n=1 Tax=Streptomyces sp. NBC_01460 TaxID=2903875 RepID=UPI002E323B7A|nr:tetratricopeptide repeat protein [Streptomyces sp. NBC_01460]
MAEHGQPQRTFAGRQSPRHPHHPRQSRGLVPGGGADRGRHQAGGTGGGRHGAVLGAEHPDTLAARANLASSYREAGRTREAITLLEQVTADRQRVLGADHPDIVVARKALARWRSARKDL